MSDTQSAQAAGQAEDIEQLVSSARDALSDEMIARLAGTLAESLDLLDRINRSRLARALPVITQLVDNGDLERIVQTTRVLAAAGDSMNDEMVGRMAGVVGDGLDFLDRVNRSRLGDALAVITQLVDNGDLERIAHLARLLGAAEDALNDEMIARVAGVLADSLSLLEQLTRNNALGQILTFFLRPEVQNVLVRWGEALLGASTEYQQLPPPKGGIGGWWRLLRDPSNQQAMQFFGLFGKHLQGRRH